MRILLSILLLIANGMYSSAQCPFDKNVKRILFLGNSITYDGRFVSQIETFFVQHYPACEYEFINVGLPSETVSGLSEEGHADGRFPRPDLHERLNRVLALTKPDLVFACYGMNDGIYQPLDEKRFQAFKDGITWLHRSLDSAGVKKIIHITPPVHDDKVLRTGGYNKVLDAYSDWIVSYGRTKSWNVIDLHKILTDDLNRHLSKDSSYRVAPDQVHPNDEGHWLMARVILRELGQSVNENMILELEMDEVKKEQYKLICERQSIMKDAWLTASKHLRPGMKQGLSLEDARKKYGEIQKLLDDLKRKENTNRHRLRRKP